MYIPGQKWIHWLILVIYDVAIVMNIHETMLLITNIWFHILYIVDNIVICPLSGTIIFKKLSYISKNESIYIERGYITVLWSFINKRKSKNEDQAKFVSNFKGMNNIWKMIQFFIFKILYNEYKFF